MRLVILFLAIIFSSAAFATEGEQVFRCQGGETLTMNKSEGTARTSNGGSLICENSKGQFAAIMKDGTLTVTALNDKSMMEVIKSMSRGSAGGIGQEVASE